jgi:hypothetical protein
MRVLIDECVPQKLQHEFPGHDVRTVVQMGWTGKKNGELLGLAVAGGFEVLLTVDQHLHDQNDIQKAGIGLIVLCAKSNRLDDLKLLVPAAELALASIQPGDVVEVQ